MSDRAYGHYTDDVVMSHEFGTHMDKMTREKLHSKSEIAAELAWRDQQIAKLGARVAELDAWQQRALHLLKRYRQETPPGHQPHMICHVADEIIAAAPTPQEDA